MIRVAAVGDIHFGTDSAGTLRPHLADLSEQADVFLLAGDLTRRGLIEEAQVLADELAGVDVPMFAVLGNHDYHSVQEDGVTRVMEEAGVRVLEGKGAIVTVGGCRVGIAGTKGFGGGFAGACGSEFGEPAMKSFIAYTRHLADRLEATLAALGDVTDLRVALLHYSPTGAPSRASDPRSTPSWGATCWGRRSIGREPTWFCTAMPTRARRGLDRRRHRSSQRGPAPTRPALQRLLPAPPARRRRRRRLGGRLYSELTTPMGQLTPVPPSPQ